MALARGKFGIEYNPSHVGQHESSGLGWVFVVVAIVALVSLTWTVVKRVRSRSEAQEEPKVETRVAVNPSPAPPPPPPNPVVDPPDYDKRPAKVRNLLMRLEEAERGRNLEMAVTTIESLRALPGSLAADLDQKLARRLSELNISRLFDRKNAQWVKEVEVKRGDSASRIAIENGSTLASLAKLNGGDLDRIVIGKKLYVMDHPRFNLVFHRRARIADLSLNGKFFRRYDLGGDLTAAEGAYELPDKKRAFWTRIGAQLKPADRDELEMLLPARTPVLISEM